MSGIEAELTKSHDVVERQTSRAGESWHGLIFCSCGWAGGVFDYPKRAMAEVALDATWASHARQDRGPDGSTTDTGHSNDPLVPKWTGATPP